MAVDALKSGAVGAAFPVAFKGAKEIAKAVVPGAKAGAANTVVANLSRVTGVSKEQAKAYKEMLDNPDKYKQAIEAADSFVKNADEYLIKAGNLDKKVRDAVSSAYGNLEKQAVRFNIQPENAEVFQKVSGEVTDGFNALLQQAADKDFYSSGTRNALKKASRIMVNDTPEAKKLLESGTPAAMIKLQEMSAKAALEARRTIDDVLYKGGEKGTKTLSASDEQILQEARDLAQKAVQTDLPGASSMKEADALFSAFKQKAESYLKQFSGKDQKPDINKLTGFLKGAGGQNQQAVREINEQRFMNYIQENSSKLGLSKSTVNELIEAAKPLRDAQDLARLGAQTGQSTGRSLMGIGLTGALGFVAGPVGAAVGAASLPVTNPAAYLAAINQMRNVVDKIGEKKAGQLFGKSWPKVKQAIAKTTATNLQREGEE
jgi:carbon monoxide dehydrogenase subunit G